MGEGASRLYNSLTQTLSSTSPLSLPAPHLDPHPPVDTNLDPASCQVTLPRPLTEHVLTRSTQVTCGLISPLELNQCASLSGAEGVRSSGAASTV